MSAHLLHGRRVLRCPGTRRAGEGRPAGVRPACARVYVIEQGTNPNRGTVTARVDESVLKICVSHTFSMSLGQWVGAASPVYLFFIERTGSP